MGRSFKLQNRSQKKKVVKEPVVEQRTYDHRHVIKTNDILIYGFKKNMTIPSKLWDSNENMTNYNTVKHDPSVFPDRGSCCVTFNKCICYDCS